MADAVLVDITLPTRELRRALRRTSQVNGQDAGAAPMPECAVWQAFVELRRRGESSADSLFLGTLRSLHTRRSIAGSTLGCDDVAPDEHRLIDDAYLADLWKAYKKCLRTQRTGPAAELLRAIEDRLEYLDVAA